MNPPTVTTSVYAVPLAFGVMTPDWPPSSSFGCHVSGGTPPPEWVDTMARTIDVPLDCSGSPVVTRLTPAARVVASGLAQTDASFTKIFNGVRQIS